MPQEATNHLMFKTMTEIKTPWSPVGYLTYKRTYARNLPTGGTEEFKDTVERIVTACRTQLNVGFTSDEEDRLRYYLLSLKASVAGRFWWQLGTSTVERLGLPSLQNCAFTVIDSPVRPFCWAMDLLALGSGVGFNIQREHVSKLPPVKSWFKPPTRVDDFGADFIIPDSREGWVKFLGKTLKAAFLSDSPEKGTFTYCVKAIRGKGQPIKGFGGTASGPEELCQGIQWISEILQKQAGKQIRPIHALDIMNIIGYIIVAGNVRRSAQIAIGDHDDIEYLLAKRWDLGNIPSWRAMSNNSVVCEDTRDLSDYFWAGYNGQGEPYGLINLKLSRETGRIGDLQYKDPGVMGYNP
jgi:ribonucleoside-triphosphate reductase